MTLLDDVTKGLAGRYRVDREIGRGGMATVYLAHDLRHDRQVALKLLVPQLAAQLSDERFQREIRVIAGLSHPHILPLLDSGRLDAAAGSSAGQPWFVMPFVAGESLRTRLDREPQLPMESAARIIREVAAALDFAHEHGVVHRDIKPENILLFEGRAMVADFGIARALGAETERMTATGMIVGTPTYMSPEQAAGDGSLDGRSDQYALACVLYEMLTGAPPFSGATAQALIARHALDTPSPVRTIRPEVSADIDVDGVLRRAMAKSPADRFATTTEFARALTVPAAVAAGRWRGRRRSALPVILGVAILAALVVAYRAHDVRRTDPGSVPSNRTRVAVLPLRSVSPNSADQYFADGMTDEIAGTLASIGELRVIARSSLGGFSHPGSRTTAEVARELDVGSIVGGSVRKAGNQLRISVELSDARTGEARWQHTYDKTLTDVFVIQRDVAIAVASALRVALLAREASQLNKRPTTDTAAYDAYLRASVLAVGGRYRPNYREAMDTAILLLRRAVREDSSFAPGWAALGSTYATMIFEFGVAAYRDSARHAADRALQIDPQLADGYVARSDLAYTREGGWKIDEALRDVLYALSLKPSDIGARSSLVSLSAHIGLLRESQREMVEALAIDPASAFVRYRVPRSMWQQQRFAEALSTYVRDRQAGWKTSIPEEALVLGYLGRAEEGLRLLDGKATSPEMSGDVEAARGVLLARVGRVAEARANLARSEQLGGARSHFHHAAFAIATAHAIMGEKAEAVRWLERTAGDGMPAYDLFAGDPTLVTLKGVPAFEALMNRLRTDSERYRRVYRESR